MVSSGFPFAASSFLPPLLGKARISKTTQNGGGAGAGRCANRAIVEAILAKAQAVVQEPSSRLEGIPP
eukprot:3684526-Pyramimonas_sp.AAC.1